MKEKQRTIFESLLTAVSLVLFSGCFAHQEAPEREITASSIEDAEAIITTVERIKLNNYDKQELPSSLAKMEKLKTLYLPGSAITNFTELQNLKSLKVLDLTSVKLNGACPKELGRIDTLCDLYLGSTGLRDFPGEITSLPCLRYLNLDRNFIKDLPATLPTGLKWLRLNQNAITNLPPAIGTLTNLKRLYLAKNKITNLPSEISALTNLEDLDLSYNELTVFPEVITKLPKLRNLDLKGNKNITNIPNLSSMKALRTLTLTGCPIDNETKARIRKELDNACFIVF